MPGLESLKSRHKEDKESQNFSSGTKFLRLGDGERAFVRFVVSGKPDDNEKRFDEVKTHTFQVSSENASTYWKTVLCDGEKCKKCSKTEKPSSKFGVWAYVYYITHQKNKDSSDWKEVEQPGGKVYKEDVNDFRLFLQGYGKGDYLWNQLVEIYTDLGDLSKNIVKITRTGAQRDTSYTIVATGTVAKYPDKAAEKNAKELLGVAETLKADEEVEKSKPVKLNGGEPLELGEAADETEDLF